MGLKDALFLRNWIGKAKEGRGRHVSEHQKCGNRELASFFSVPRGLVEQAQHLFPYRELGPKYFHVRLPKHL